MASVPAGKKEDGEQRSARDLVRAPSKPLGKADRAPGLPKVRETLRTRRRYSSTRRRPPYRFFPGGQPGDGTVSIHGDEELRQVRGLVQGRPVVKNMGCGARVLV